MRNLVLAVDDSRAILSMVSRAVESLGYRTLTARDAFAALASLAQHCDEVQLIILDRHMPGMDGLHALRSFKDNPRTKEIPVLMLSADAECAEEALRLGASYQLSKPFNEASLTAYLKGVLPALDAAQTS